MELKGTPRKKSKERDFFELLNSKFSPSKRTGF
jgi:hypothetical protein